MSALKKVAFALATAGLLSSGMAQAALNDRGGGLLYDDVLNVTWLQDANYASTSGYDADGRMTWGAAKTWVNGLTISRFAGESLTGWRLASNAPVNGTWDHSQLVASATGTWNYNYSAAGTTDIGYNIKSPNSELSYMYYVNLGLKGARSETDASQSDYGILGNDHGGSANVGLVKNLVESAYWSGMSAPNPFGVARGFDVSSGYQINFGQNQELYAWAVRPGDVASVMAPIPEPETYAMMLAGLGLLGVAARRRKQKSVA